jgi:hypothetical protein
VSGLTKERNAIAEPSGLRYGELGKAFLTGFEAKLSD